MTVLPMVLISVRVIMRMCAVLVLPVVAFAMVRWAMVVGHHGDFLFLGSKSLQMVTAAMKPEDDCFLAGKRWQT